VVSRQVERERGTRTERGYDNDWLRKSKAQLALHPECFDCGGVAVDAHHVVKGDDRTLMSLCRACHNRRTRRGE
jgi:5-methylcytosine-specific restriction endonuclease McrA